MRFPLRLDESAIIESEEVSPGVVLDDDDANEVVDVERIRLSKHSSALNLSALQFETTSSPVRPRKMS